jgi:para-aminobenzoate synthetase component 1
LAAQATLASENIDMLVEPIIEEIPLPADPATAFASLLSRPGAFWLDSALADGDLGRYSFVGAEPFLTVVSKGWRIELRRPRSTEIVDGDPFRVLAGLWSRYRVAATPGLPPLTAGAVGYFAYDLCHFIERVPTTTADDAPIPDCYLGFYDALIAIDHAQGRAWLCSSGLPETGRRGRERAQRRLQRLRELLLNPPPQRASTAATPSDGSPQVTSNFSQASYLAAIGRAKEYIAAGDIFQVNLSQRLSAPMTGSAYDLYGRLREINPAPFAAYLHLDRGDPAIVCSSPERFLRVRHGAVETRPIKGTRPRGLTPAEDARLAQELLTSGKDRAENVMIVDLERNDLGRVCRYGSVRARDLCALETYATVFHLVSTVEGDLHEGKTPWDLLRACFPGGSITGAPKVRAMQIIDELEPTRRGVYTGAIGYVSFAGDMDLNVVIRTFLVRDGRAHFQVGGGIVADSDPEAEYEETLNKGRALAEAATGRRGIVVVPAESGCDLWNISTNRRTRRGG